jgi:hypothetical protein
MNEKDVGRAVTELIESVLGNVHTCMPGRVESYSYAKQKATVTPLLKRAFVDGSQLAYEPIPDVPVVFPASGVASLTFPLNAGDTVLLVFAERSMEKWLPAGGAAETTVNRLHDLGDAIAIPGLFPLNRTSDAGNNADLQLNLGSQKITIKANGDIEIGNMTIPSVPLVADPSLATGDFVTAVCATLAILTGGAYPVLPNYKTSKVTAK